MQSEGKDPKKKSGGNKKLLNVMIVLTLTLFIINALVGAMISENQEILITYDVFLEMIENGEAEKVEISSDRLKLYTPVEGESESGSVYYTGSVGDQRVVEIILSHGVTLERPLPSSIWDSWLLPALPSLLFYGFLHTF